MLKRVQSLDRWIKVIIMILCDCLLLQLALWTAIALRLGTITPAINHYVWLFPALTVSVIPIFFQLGMYRIVVRYINEKLVSLVFKCVTMSVLVLTALTVFFRIGGLPRTSIIIYWILAMAYLIAVRLVAKSIFRRFEAKPRNKEKVAIYGAGRAGLQTALALFSGREYLPIAFFDDDINLHGRSVAGLPVFSPERALAVMEKKSCKQLLLAMPSVARSRRAEIIRKFEGKSITLKTLPGLGNLVDGSVRVEDIRDVGLEDLLGRDPVPPIERLIGTCVEDKSVLVTGAGGSIGSELCRQILKLKPRLLILFEKSEFNLYRIEQELQHLFPKSTIIAVLGDVCNKDFVSKILKDFNVQTVYHAAAYKHVPIVEKNIISGVTNNVFGTLACAKASVSQAIETFVLISTDKAVRPTNIMGATKRMAELILQGLAQESPATRFCMVRFGNVLGSSGSVVPLFKEQIKKGGPLTVTHPEVTRYFMTIPEAAQLVLQAGAMGNGGDVFVLDMGEPIKIVDLAKRIIEFSGLEVMDPLTGKGDIAIEYMGLRPGEKLYEELLIGETVEWTEHPRIMRAHEKSLELNYLIGQLEAMEVACTEGNTTKLVNQLRTLVPEYHDGKNLDH